MKRIYFLNNWRRRILFYLLIVVTFAAALEIVRIRNNSFNKLAAERNRQQLQNVIPFERLELPQHFFRDIRFWQNTNCEDALEIYDHRRNYNQLYSLKLSGM